MSARSAARRAKKFGRHVVGTVVWTILAWGLHLVAASPPVQAVMDLPWYLFAFVGLFVLVLGRWKGVAVVLLTTTLIGAGLLLTPPIVLILAGLSIALGALQCLRLSDLTHVRERLLDSRRPDEGPDRAERLVEATFEVIAPRVRDVSQDHDRRIHTHFAPGVTVEQHADVSSYAECVVDAHFTEPDLLQAFYQLPTHARRRYARTVDKHLE